MNDDSTSSSKNDDDSGRSLQHFSNHHPVLARMMQSLKRQRLLKKSFRSYSDAFVETSSFASSNNNKKDLLFGRDEEMKKLQAVFNRLVVMSSSKSISSAHGKSELVFVHGKSGTGKSSLVQAFVKGLSHQKNVKFFFAEGKFDQLKAHVPYAALISASNDLAKQILQLENSKEIMEHVKSQLGPDISMLIATLPAFSQMVEDKTASDGTSPVDGQAFARFKLLMRTFLRSIAMENKPVILFLDDLQWVDMGTLEIIRSLLSDTMSRNIMFLFSYRDDEMDPEIIQQLQSTEAPDISEKSGCVRVTDIDVANLDLTSLNKMMSDALGMNDKQTEDLCKIIHNKTCGNPYHAINFMDMLHSKGMLTPNEEEEDEKEGNWTWDCDYILQQTDVSANLADILEAKILRLPEKIRSILQLASFIGYDFSTDVLTTIVHEEQDMIEGEYSFDSFDKQVIHQWIIQALDVASREGLVEVTSSTDTYKFSHDRIQQCLYRDLMPDDVERRLLHQRIGKLLWQTVKSRDASDVDDWILFLAADNLNRGPKFVDDDVDRCEMIELNLRAARLAQEKVAFLVAVEYLRAGEKLVKDDQFIDSNYELCLRFFNAAADGERKVGCFPRCNAFLNRIFKYARSLEDRFPAYKTEVQVTAEQKGLEDAMSLSFERLRLVGVEFPKNITSSTVLRELIRTKFLIGRRKPEDLVKLHMMSDKHKLFAMELLCATGAYAFFAGEAARLTFVIVLLRMMYLTVRFGLSDCYSPQAFVGYGILHSVFGKFDIATSYGKQGMALLCKLKSEKMLGQTKIMHLSFIHPWKHGFDGILDGLKDGCHKAMCVGDVEFAFWGMNSWLPACFYSFGVPLPKLAKEGMTLCTEMKEYGLKTQESLALPLVQVLLNLTGENKTPNPAVLSGDAIDLEKFRREIQERNNMFLVRALAGYEALLAYYFGDWELWKNKVSIVLESALDVKGIFTTPFIVSFRAWYCYVLYKQTGMRKYKQKGRVFYSQVKKLAKEGGILASALSKQLAAGEALYIKKKSPKQVENLFIDALDEMKARKMSYNPAILSESLAESFIEAGNNEKAIKAYLRVAFEINKKWGAFAKARLLEEKLSALE